MVRRQVVTTDRHEVVSTTVFRRYVRRLISQDLKDGTSDGGTFSETKDIVLPFVLLLRPIPYTLMEKGREIATEVTSLVVTRTPPPSETVSVGHRESGPLVDSDTSTKDILHTQTHSPIHTHIHRHIHTYTYIYTRRTTPKFPYRFRWTYPFPLR